MNKLGFYSHQTSFELEQAIAAVKPPTITAHAQDASFWRKVREHLSPDSFIIGRIYAPQHRQERYKIDPEAEGVAFAEEVIAHEISKMEINGRPVFDAWMSFNEAVPGPRGPTPSEEEIENYRRYDRFQVAFGKRLQEAGLEAVAMNFAAGNFSDGRVWVEYFPNTLETYKYLGFHEYGWPTMSGEGGATGCLLYRPVMQAVRERYGHKHRVIITECGLARGYAYPHEGDVGWRYPGDPRTVEEYWASLKWYNDELNKAPYVLGACIFQVGHGPRWETFEILGTGLIDKIASLKEEVPLPAPPHVTVAAAEEDELSAFRRSALAQLDAIAQKAQELQAAIQAYRDFLQREL